MVKLAHGDTSCIKSLSTFRSTLFSIADPEIVESTFKIVNIGHSIFTSKLSKDEIPIMMGIESHLAIISSKITTLLDLKEI